MKTKIKPIMSSPDIKVILVSGAPGDMLEKHKVNEPGLLLVKKGSITYQEEDNEPVNLSENDGYSIPAEVYHQVTCVERSAFFVVIPQKAKMRFEK